MLALFCYHVSEVRNQAVGPLLLRPFDLFLHLNYDLTVDVLRFGVLRRSIVVVEIDGPFDLPPVVLYRFALRGIFEHTKGACGSFVFV